MVDNAPTSAQDKGQNRETPAHDHSACPDFGDQAEWTTQQATGGFGRCGACGKTGIHLRVEPFSGWSCCKKCWEAIVYDE